MRTVSSKGMRQLNELLILPNYNTALLAELRGHMAARRDQLTAAGRRDAGWKDAERTSRGGVGFGPAQKASLPGDENSNLPDCWMEAAGFLLAQAPTPKTEASHETDGMRLHC